MTDRIDRASDAMPVVLEHRDGLPYWFQCTRCLAHWKAPTNASDIDAREARRHVLEDLADHSCANVDPGEVRRLRSEAARLAHGIEDYDRGTEIAEMTPDMWEVADRWSRDTTIAGQELAISGRLDPDLLRTACPVTGRYHDSVADHILWSAWLTATKRQRDPMGRARQLARHAVHLGFLPADPLQFRPVDARLAKDLVEAELQLWAEDPPEVGMVLPEPASLGDALAWLEQFEREACSLV